jgi:transcriptional regulator with XRE-family HTH domain
LLILQSIPNLWEIVFTKNNNRWILKSVTMSPSAYSGLENGETQITINTLEKVAKVLKLNMADLIQSNGTQTNTFTKNIIAQNNSSLHFTLTPEEFTKLYNKIKEDE